MSLLGQLRAYFERGSGPSPGKAPFPHCDPRILHAPGECLYCDDYKVAQGLREVWGIAFTGKPAPPDGLPCPADRARGDTHKRWHGNIARPAAMGPVRPRRKT